MNVPYIARHASICGRKAITRHARKTPLPIAVRVKSVRSPARRARANSRSASMPGSSAKSTFCHRIIADNPMSTPSIAQSRGRRVSCVAPHIQAKPATDAIEAACVMLGSLTRYHSMNEPATVRTTAGVTKRPGKYRRENRQVNQHPSSP
jgi:hypothetical protein